MSFRFLDWFQAPSGEAAGAQDQNGGYVAPVKNTFIHFGELEQPDYRPARSGPAKVETAPEHFSGTLPRLQEEGGPSDSFSAADADAVAVDAVESPRDAGDEGPSTPATTSMASACFEALTPVEAPIKNTFIHFDEQQPDYTSTVSGPAILRSAPPKTAVGPAPAPKTTVTAVTEDAALPSVGSLGHANGTCKPCAHNWKDAGCSKGQSCTFCHLCEAEDFHRRRKEKTQRLKAERSRKKGEKEELKTSEAAAPRPVGLLDTLEVHEAQAAAVSQASQAQPAMAPGELQLSYESDCVVVRWCVDLRRLCSQYRYGLSRRFVVRFTEEVPFVLFLNPAASAGAFSTAELRATMQVKCTDPCPDMPHLQMLFGVDDQPAAVVEDHDFQVEPLCAAQGTTWHLGDTTAILRVQLSVRP